MSRAESARSVVEQKQERGRIPAGMVAWDIHNVAQEIGHTPSQIEYDALGEFTATTARARFGRWLLAIEATGLEPTPTQRRGERSNRLTTPDLARAIRRAWRKHGRPPTAREAAACRRRGFNSINLRGKCWDDMLAAAGVPTKRGTVADDIRERWDNRYPWQDFLRFDAAAIEDTTDLHRSRIGHIIRELRDDDWLDDLTLRAVDGGGSSAQMWEVRADG